MPFSVPLGSYEDDKVKFTIEAHDTLLVEFFRCENNSEVNAFGKLTQKDPDTGELSSWAIYGQSFPPGVTLLPVNSNITLVPNPNKPGKYLGYEFEATVPG